MKISAVLIAVFALVATALCFERPKKCLPGTKHKAAPSAENSLQACQAYKNDACCTAKFTEQLAPSTIKGIGNFSWSPCNNGTLSPKCQAFMVNVECFYRCSHNAIFWKNPDFPSAMSKAPLCASECNAWLDACKDDLTCAKNWVTDYNMSSDGVNTCKSQCRKYSDVYSSGKDLCENLWGTTFISKDAECLKLRINDTSSNDKLVEKMFGKDNTTSAPKVTTIQNGAFALTTTLFLAMTPLLSLLLI